MKKIVISGIILVILALLVRSVLNGRNEKMSVSDEFECEILENVIFEVEHVEMEYIYLKGESKIIFSVRYEGKKRKFSVKTSSIVSAVGENCGGRFCVSFRGIIKKGEIFLVDRAYLRASDVESEKNWKEWLRRAKEMRVFPVRSEGEAVNPLGASKFALFLYLTGDYFLDKIFL